MKKFAASLVLVLAALPSAVFAQQCNLAGSPATTLRAPLVPGASFTPPGSVAPTGQAPAVGDGAVPCGVTPGHYGPPTTIPSNPYQPGGIGQCDYYAPYNEGSVWAPGQMGQSTYAPGPPSTPGCDPGNFGGPRDFYSPPVGIGTVAPGGGIVGWAPTQRWGGQTTTDWGLYKHQGTRSFDFGQGMWGQTSQDGPWQTRPGAVPTWDLYGQRTPDRGPGIQTIAPY